MPLIDRESEIDKTPITLRLHCQKCETKRLMQCQLVHLLANNTNIVKATCLTCNHVTTA